MPNRIPYASLIRLGLAFLIGCAGSASAQGPDSVSAAGQDTSSWEGFPTHTGPIRAVHPGYRMFSLTPEGHAFKVTGMDWMSNGDLALLTISDTVSPYSGGGFGAVYRLKGARAAVSNALQAEKLYEGFLAPLGLAVAEDSIFVSDFAGLRKLVDADGDGRFDSLRVFLEYPGKNAIRFGMWNMALIHAEDRFYTALGSFHFVSPAFDSGACAPEPDRGTVHVADRSGRVEFLGSGLREPNGLVLSPEGELFATENDGEWVPTNKLVHIRKGEFYGTCVGTEWDPSLTHTPPAIWFPELLRSPGQPIFLHSGPYRGQMVVGDYEILVLSRIFLEKVGGRYQGALFPFSGGLITGATRLAQDPEGNLYLGEMEIESSDAWWYRGETRNRPTHIGYGLEKMIPAGDSAFEMLAVRATPKGFALDFTRPAGPAASAPASYRITQWRYQPTYRYGGPKLDSVVLPVAAASLSPDGRTATLDIPGLEPNRVVYIQLHRDFRSRAGEAPWGYEAWYTLNAIPGRENALRRPDAAEPAAFTVARGGTGRAEIRITLREAYAWEIRDLRGERVRSGAGTGPRSVSLDAALPPGMYSFGLRTSHRQYRGLIPPV